MNHHRQALTPILALALISALAAGCSPAAEPTPTPTPAFASEEEAFAAAEETYREFTMHLNQVDTTDPETFEPLYELSSGEFEAADRKAYSKMHAERVVIDGDTRVLSFSGESVDGSSVIAQVCLDVSEVTVVDSDGISQVDPGRPEIYPLRVTFLIEGENLLIDSASLDGDIACDAS